MASPSTTGWTDSRRRPSRSHSRSPTRSPRLHTPDGIPGGGGEGSTSAQVEQDLSFFAGPSSPILRGQHHEVPPLSAARAFYVRHRNLSDASVDSQAAFIDHRSHPIAIARSPEHVPFHARTRANTVGSYLRPSRSQHTASSSSPEDDRNLAFVPPLPDKHSAQPT